MKRSLSVGLLLVLCLAVPSALACEPSRFQPTEHGIGFSLSLDYATCSVHFENGTSVDVAKIEGSLLYKHVMRNLQGIIRANSVGKESTWDPFVSWLQHYVPVLSRFHDAVDRWLRPHSLEVKAIENMLVALKTAAEAYLGVPVPVADLGVPMSLSPNARQLLEAACSAAGLDRALGFPSAGPLAAMANGIGSYYANHTSCSTGKESLILAVDYSRAALTAALFWEEYCVFEMIHEMHDTSLGARTLDTCTEARSVDCGDLATALAEFLDRHVRFVLPGIHTKINSLVLLGENGNDQRLREVLQKVMDAYGLRIGLTPANHEGSVVDPTFAAARGIAAASWENQNGLF